MSDHQQLSKRRKRALLGAFAATAVAVALIARWSGEEQSSTGESAGAREPPPASEEPAAAGAGEDLGSGRATDEAAANARSASNEPTRAAEAVPPHAASPAAQGATSLDAGAGSLASGQAAASPDFPRTPQATRRGDLHRARAAAPASNQTSNRGPRAREPNAAASPVTARDAAAAPGTIDLRSVPRHQQRELDLENPFRK